jgi:peptide/nickel transport system substrate-binding protein
LTALKAGEIDFDSRLTPIQYARQTSGASFDSEFRKSAFNIPQLSYIVWNSERPFFADKRVRQAMTMLIPRQQIIDNPAFRPGGTGHFTLQPEFSGLQSEYRGISPRSGGGSGASG